MTLWERACSRKHWVRQWMCKLCRRLREQARSHSGRWRPHSLFTPRTQWEGRCDDTTCPRRRP
ncbi:MAG: hypothetical protein C0438_05445 [Pseudomonas sp.]|nr:hypothetical protein [Pseudomonas sp.]